MPDGPRVLLVMSESSGGIGRHLRAVATGLVASGLAVSICAPAATVATFELDRLGVPVTAAPVGSSTPGARRRVRRLLRAAAADVDVVHAHGLRAAADCARALRRVPLVTTWHNAEQGSGAQRFAFALLSRYVALRSAVTLTASPDLAAVAQRRGARDVRVIFVLAPPLPAAAVDRSEARAALGVTTEPLVLAVGRLHAQKRFDVLVAAAAAWSGSPGSPAVVIAGDGPLLGALRSAARASGAPVRLLGERSDIADLLAAADVVVLPSEWEARSLVAQEAMRAGVPLVTTPVGGLPSLVGDAAILVPVGDAPALRRAVESIVSDPAEHARLTAAGRAQAASWPTADQERDDLIAVYMYLDLRTRRSGR